MMSFIRETLDRQVERDLKRHQSSRMAYGAPRFHQWHHLPIVLISPSSILFISSCLSLSDDCQMIVLNAGKLLSLAVLSAYSFLSTSLTLRLFCLLPSAPLSSPVWSLPYASCRRSSADNTGGGSGGPGLPGNFLTNHIAAVNLLHSSPVSLLLSVCTVGRQFLFFGHNPYSLEGFRHPKMFVWSQE